MLKTKFLIKGFFKQILVYSKISVAISLFQDDHIWKRHFIFKESVISNEVLFQKNLVFEIISGTETAFKVGALNIEILLYGLFVQKLRRKIGCF